MEALRFLHIPKTAGTTFTEILKRQYLGAQSFSLTGDTVSVIKRFETLSSYDREQVKLFTGHAPIITGVDRADNATTITFLRNPINRVKSFCQHVSEGKSPHLIDNFPPETFSLDAFLASEDEELSNLQTKMLINQGSYASALAINNMSPSEAKGVALDNLFNKISHFGLQEYFDESLIIFSSAFNWRMPLYISKNIKSTNKLIQFEPHHLKRIAELNAIDMEVYEHAEEQFLRVINSTEFDKAKLQRFRFINMAVSLTRGCARRLLRFVS